MSKQRAVEHHSRPTAGDNALDMSLGDRRIARDDPCPSEAGLHPGR